MRNKLMIIIGKSCTGKSTIINNLVHKSFPENIKNIIINTTRPPRKGEENGVDYIFTTSAKIKQKIKQEKQKYNSTDCPLLYKKYKTYYGIFEYYLNVDEFDKQLNDKNIDLLIMNGFGKPKEIGDFISKARYIYWLGSIFDYGEPEIIYIKSSWYVRLIRHFKRLKKNGITIRGILEIIRRLLSEFKDYFGFPKCFTNKFLAPFNISIIESNSIDDIYLMINYHIDKYLSASKLDKLKNNFKIGGNNA